MMIDKMNKIRARKCRKCKIVQDIAGDMQNFAGRLFFVDERLAVMV